MNLISSPVASLHGDISVPGDKSISHRAVILGSIAEGTTIIHGFLDGDDCLATMKAFQALGVEIESRPTEPRQSTEPRPLGSGTFPLNSSETVIIHGVGKFGLQQPKAALDCGNSGTSMRLLAGLLAAQPFDSVLTGDDSLLKRPMERIRRPLLQMGADMTTHNGRAPLYIHGGQSLQGIAYDMPEASAQVKSCLLLAGLYANGETKIIEPTSTRDHTERMLASFSYPIARVQDDLIITINSCHQLLATEITVPGDMSSAAFFIVAATIIPNADLYIRGVGINPTRTGILLILKAMGAKIRILNERLYGGEPVADLHVQYAPLQGIEINPSMVPAAIDEFPILFIAAACAQGQTVLRGAKELRFKESDRITTMAEGLNQIGIKAQALNDGIVIHGGVPQGGVVDSQGDHRIAMAFAIAGTIAQSRVIIKNCDTIATSFPTFLETAKQINLSVKRMDDE
jgi:3-phosphoshikimate 1-carboxyvinyltransferase